MNSTWGSNWRCSTRIAIASNPDAAVHAARGFSGITVIPPGEEAWRLAPLPLAVLAPPAEMLEIFARWGIRTLGDLAALPEEGVAGRLGPEGVRLRRLARGAGSRPLVPLASGPAFVETLELEYPVHLLEPLMFLLARLLSDVCTRLAVYGVVSNEFRLALKLRDGTEHARTHRLPYPVRDTRAFLKVLHLDLEAHPPSTAIMAVTLAAVPTDPRTIQNGLFLPAAPEPDRLELTLARLSKVVGEANVGAAELLDTHRSEPFRMKRFGWNRPTGQPGRYVRRLRRAYDGKDAEAGRAACPTQGLRVFRPSVRAKVYTSGGRPVRVEARGLRGRIVFLAGPWRSSGEWWSAQPWSRDEWDAGFEDGTLYRLYLDRQSDAWFVAGAYD